MSAPFGTSGGVPLTCLYDNPRTLVLGRQERDVQWHPVFQDFARYCGYTPRACQPYRADEGQGREWREVRQTQCARWPTVCLLGRAQHLVGGMEQHGRGSAGAWDHHERPIDRFVGDAHPGAGLPIATSAHTSGACDRRLGVDWRRTVLGAGPVRRDHGDRTETTTHYAVFAGTVCIARHVRHHAMPW